MRIGFVRTDIQRFYLNDVENTSQRCFSSEPRGQSRYFRYATVADLLVPLNRWGILSLRGSVGAATFATTAPANVLKIKQTAAATFTSITVTSGAAVPIATVIANLNSGFYVNGLPFIAVNDGANHVQINTVAPTNSGPAARIQLDTGANGSTLNAILGYNVLGDTVVGLTVAAVAAIVRPTPTTINVSVAAINGMSTFTLLTAAQQALLRDGDNANGIADVIAPRLVETGPVLLSYVWGNLSKLRSVTFQPGGARIGLPAGIAAYIVEDDGVSVFTI